MFFTYYNNSPHCCVQLLYHLIFSKESCLKEIVSWKTLYFKLCHASPTRICRSICTRASQLRDSSNILRARVPNCLSTNADQPDKAEAVDIFVSRYNRWHLKHFFNLWIFESINCALYWNLSYMYLIVTDTLNCNFLFHVMRIS